MLIIIFIALTIYTFLDSITLKRIEKKIDEILDRIDR